MDSKKTIKQVTLQIAVVISVVELLIMLVLGVIPYDINPMIEALIDTFFLVLLSTPIIYLWVIKPFIVARNEAKHLAQRDPLTLVSNRLYLKESLERCLAMCARHNTYAALLFIDLDDFKCVNDMCGHNIGDALLIEVAKRMQSITRQEDAIFRLGGDEFLVLLHQLNNNKDLAKNKAINLAEKYQKILKESFHLDEAVLQVNSSIGIRILGGKRQDVDTIIKEADSAMYQAKNKGGGEIALFNE